MTLISSDTTSGFARRQSRAGSFLGPPRLFAQNYYPPIQHTVVVDGALPGSEPKDEVKVRKRETIFGPDVGDDDQPGWTEAGDGKAVSVDVIKRWVDKAKGEEVSARVSKEADGQGVRMRRFSVHRLLQ